MKNTTLLILLSLFITSCGEKIREEITERYDNGKMKTIMKFIGEGSDIFNFFIDCFFFSNFNHL